jgi:hypothetical protein
MDDECFDSLCKLLRADRRMLNRRQRLRDLLGFYRSYLGHFYSFYGRKVYPVHWAPPAVHTLKSVVLGLNMRATRWFAAIDRGRRRGSLPGMRLSAQDSDDASSGLWSASLVIRQVLAPLGSHWGGGQDFIAA